MTRRGFTLVELLVTLVVLGVLGGALARITINQSRYVSQQEALMEARQVARQAMYLLTTEMQMVPEGGTLAVRDDSVTLRIPYAFGMLCAVNGSGNRIAVLLPSDSVAFANATPAGVAWRSTGPYTFASGVSVASSTDVATCQTDSIRAITGGRLVALSPASMMSGALAGDVMFLYQTVTYKFAASTALPGRRALWRRSGGVSEELLAPFDAAARFAFLTGPRLALTTNPPGANDLRGLELRLVSQSVSIPAGRTTYTTYDMRPRVRFGNYPP